jgi:hypothetical protein
MSESPFGHAGGNASISRFVPGSGDAMVCVPTSSMFLQARKEAFLGIEGRRAMIDWSECPIVTRRKQVAAIRDVLGMVPPLRRRPAPRRPKEE